MTRKESGGHLGSGDSFRVTGATRSHCVAPVYFCSAVFLLIFLCLLLLFNLPINPPEAITLSILGVLIIFQPSPCSYWVFFFSGFTLSLLGSTLSPAQGPQSVRGGLHITDIQPRYEEIPEHKPPWITTFFLRVCSSAPSLGRRLLVFATIILGRHGQFALKHVSMEFKVELDFGILNPEHCQQGCLRPAGPKAHPEFPLQVEISAYH
ncbi:unnamed protein product [Ranitomeya imitator]|uniref:Uncharacterized protein n=1 Tax=Ranitomeya imitator TaxID=111125 RepID=A0ABN9MN02_9NEOB|nr:unnamed protein product [Ranitomeya imitator]